MAKSSKAENQMIQEFKDRVSKEAEQFLHIEFPKKVKELDTLLLSPLFQKKMVEVHYDLNIPVPPPVPMNDVDEPPSKRQRHGSGDAPPASASISASNHASNSASNPASNHASNSASISASNSASGGSPVYALPGGESPSNKHLVSLISVVKPLIKDLVTQTNSMKMWILFLIPKIEDGNNFGVSVQEETLSEVRQVESESATYLDQVSRYFITRGKLVSKVAKYPHVEDYRRSIEEIDEKEFLSLQLTVAELRNNYSLLHDLIIKNIDKITKPRTSTNMHIY